MHLRLYGLMVVLIMKIGLILEKITLMFINNMKTIIFISAIILRATCLGQIPQLYQDLDEAIINKSPDKIITILEEVNHKNIFSFGAGLGPSDKKYLEYFIVNISYDFMVTSELNPKWKRFYDVEFDDENEITDMLLSDNTGVRLIALRKLEGSEINDNLIDTLINIVNNDNLIFISKHYKTLNKDSDSPPSPGSSVHDFSAPLRELSYKILNDWNVNTHLSEKKIAIDGVNRLAEIFLKGNSYVKKDVLFAISMLDASSDAVHYINNASEIGKLEKDDLIKFKDAISHLK